MKIGLDLHGCIDKYPIIFRQLSNKLYESGHEIHVITGQEWDKVEPEVEKACIQFTHHFSIVDYHKALGTEMWKNDKGTWQMDEKDWVRSKGDYIHREHIDIHFDNSWEYAIFVPDFCTFILVPKSGFHEFVELFFDDAYFNNRKRFA